MVSASMAWTTMRSSSGLMLTLVAVVMICPPASCLNVVRATAGLPSRVSSDWSLALSGSECQLTQLVPRAVNVDAGSAEPLELARRAAAGRRASAGASSSAVGHSAISTTRSAAAIDLTGSRRVAEQPCQQGIGLAAGPALASHMRQLTAVVPRRPAGRAGAEVSSSAHARPPPAPAERGDHRAVVGAQPRPRDPQPQAGRGRTRSSRQRPQPRVGGDAAADDAGCPTPRVAAGARPPWR